MVSIRIMKVVPEKTGSTYCSPLVTIEIRNDGAEDLVFDHFSTKYFLEVHAKTGPVLTLDESMRLNMLYSRTTRDASEPQTVPHHAAIEITLDLAEFYYPLSEGDYSLHACCQINGKRTSRSDPVEFHVFQTGVIEDVLWYENPVFGNLSLLSKSVDDNHTEEYYLRWFNPDRPLASNFTKKLTAVPDHSEVVVSHPSFFTLEDFDPSFEKFLVCFNKKDTLQIVNLFLGEVQAVSPPITFAHEVRLLPFSFRNEQREITVFTIEGDRKINCFTISPDFTMKPVFSYSPSHSLVKYGIKNTLSVTGGPDLIHVVSFGNGLIHTMLDYQGTVRASYRLSESHDVPVYLNVNLVQNSIRVAYYSGNNKYTFFHSTYAAIDGSFTKTEKTFRLVFSPLEMLEEIDFMYNEARELQLLYTTTAGRLIYADEHLGYKRILKHRDIRYPRVVVGDIEMFRPFIGFSIPRTGYRFYSIEGHDTWKEIRHAAI